MSDPLCVCGHTADDHHCWSVVGGGSGICVDECEFYGSNDTGGLMPTHPDGQVCPHTHGCPERHTWVDHCHSFKQPKGDPQ